MIIFKPEYNDGNNELFNPDVASIIQFLYFNIIVN